MAVTTRKYNPGFLSEDELVAIFCVRIAEYESLTEGLRECSGNTNIHQMVIGPRGSGKTSLLLRVAAEMSRDADLSERFFPIIFSEESYEVSTAGEFWLECVSRLTDQAPHGDEGIDLHRTFEELRKIPDDRMLADRCLGVLQDFSDREGKRLVLIVENLNMMFRDMSDGDAGWRLRKELQTEPRIVLLASSTSRFDQMDDPKEALYELFRVIRLHPLDTEDCSTLWQTVSGQARSRQNIQALRILVGGNPRLLTIVARFGSNLSFRELMADLLNLVDDHTEYFKSHLDALPAQERKVYLALADLWKPASASEIAERARLGTSKCSAQLARLVDKGAVEVSGGSARRKLYYLTERLYNIYYQMRRARGPGPLVDALIRFMEAYYSTEELRDLGMLMVQDASGFDSGEFYRMACKSLVELLSLETHREELLSLASPAFANVSSSAVSPASSASRDLLRKALALTERGQLQDAVAAWDKIIRNIGESDACADLEQVSMALVNKGKALVKLGRAAEALVVMDDVVRRFGADNMEYLPLAAATATALVGKGWILHDLERNTEALDALEEVVKRFGESRTPELEMLVANARVGKTVVLGLLDRPRESLETCDEVLNRHGKDSSPAFHDDLASAMVARGYALVALDRTDEAINAWSAVVKRFEGNSSPRVIEQMAFALVNIGTALFESGRLEEALTTFDSVVQNHMARDMPVLREVTALCFFQRGKVLAELQRETEALSSWEEAVSKIGTDNRSERPALLNMVAVTQRYRGGLLEKLGRHEEALLVWQEVEDRFGNSDVPEWVELVAISFVQRSTNLYRLKRMEEALAICDRAVEHFGGSDVPAVSKQVAAALVSKGSILAHVNRTEDAIKVWSDVVRRFGESDASSEIATALLHKTEALDFLRRPDEALEACDEILRRFGEGSEPDEVEAVAQALVNKGKILVDLGCHEEGGAAWDEVVRRFEASDVSALRDAVESALCGRARQELTRGQASAALEFLDRVLLQARGGTPGSRVQVHMLRSRAHLTEGDAEACARDVEATLSILPELDMLTRDVLVDLVDVMAGIGPERMCDLIESSPAGDLLLPLRTALERELGMDPRVSREVGKVAEDIRRELLVQPVASTHRRTDWSFRPIRP